MKKGKRKLLAFMNNIADVTGHPWAFILSAAMIIIWFVVRPYIESEAWFNIMDISIFLTTFLLLFVLQASQNADTEAMQMKLDEIIRALPKADNTKRGKEKDLKKGKNA